MAITTQASGIAATPEQISSQLDLGISLSLTFWPALSLAVQNNWGGAASSDKRDWFAGAVSELFGTHPDTDLEDLETVLLQVMLDEFEVNVDDDSAYDVAEQILEIKKDCERGEWGRVEALRRRWETRGGEARIEFEVEEEGSSSEEESDDDEEDVEMGEAPAPREKPAPQIDEDGFETVVGKKRR